MAVGFGGRAGIEAAIGLFVKAPVVVGVPEYGPCVEADTMPLFTGGAGTAAGTDDICGAGTAITMEAKAKRPGATDLVNMFAVEIAERRTKSYKQTRNGKALKYGKEPPNSLTSGRENLRP